MSDARTKSAPQDSNRVNVNEQYELAYWIRVLGTSEEELKRAVKKVGTSLDAVRNELSE